MTAMSIVSRSFSGLTLAMIHSVLWMKSTIVVLYYWATLALASPFKHKGVKTDLILEDSKQLDKIPFHLAIILCEEDISYSDLSLMICWAFSFGIQWVSVYDMKGEIKNSIKVLKSDIDKRYYEFNGLCNQKLKVDVLSGYLSTDTTTGVNNLIVLSSEDGHSGLIDLAAKFCDESRSGVIQTSDITLSRINKMLLGSGVIQEPNLAIVCGSVHCLMGYPSWWTRLTEIMWLSSHYKVSYQQFLDVLRRYANCQQRFGK